MILMRKIDSSNASRAIHYLREHINYLADRDGVHDKNKRARYLAGEFDDSVFCINTFIESLEKCEVTYPAASQIAMYLEFRKRNLISLGLHTESVISQIKELDFLFDYFNSNQGI